MTRVIQSWDIRSTSDIRSNWGYRRTGSDMNELGDTGKLGGDDWNEEIFDFYIGGNYLCHYS